MIPCAIIIGTLPWVLQLGETVKNVASATSIAVSLAAMVLLIQIGTRRRAGDRRQQEVLTMPRSSRIVLTAIVTMAAIGAAAVHTDDSQTPQKGGGAQGWAGTAPSPEPPLEPKPPATRGR